MSVLLCLRTPPSSVCRLGIRDRDLAVALRYETVKLDWRVFCGPRERASHILTVHLIYVPSFNRVVRENGLTDFPESFQPSRWDSLGHFIRWQHPWQH